MSYIHENRQNLIIQHLCLCQSFTPMCFVLGTYDEKQTINNVLCISTGDIPILSIRESVAYSKQNLTVSKLAKLENGSLIRSSFVCKSEKGVVVHIPIIKSKNNNFEIGREVEIKI